MRSRRDNNGCAMRDSARGAWIALVLAAVLLVQNAGFAQTVHQYTLGERYTRQALFCRSPAARDALIALWSQGIGEPLPQGCSIEQISFNVSAIARNTTTSRPSRSIRADGSYGEDGPRLMVPGRFLIAQLAASRPGAVRTRVYIFFFTATTAIRTSDGGTVPELDDP
jgi:hypothetical protein